MEFLANCGLQVGVIGSALAVGLACAGSGRGVGIVGGAAAGVSLVAKRPEEMSKGIIMAIMVEFYAILCLLASFLMIFFFAA